MGNALRRVVPLAVVGCLLALAALVVSMSTPGVHRVPLALDSGAPTPSVSRARPTRSFAPPTGTVAADHTYTVPTWVQPALMIIGGLVVVMLVAFLIWRVISNTVDTRAARLARMTRPAERTRRDAVLEVVDASIAELARDDGDPRSAVIVCWVRLEEVASAAGVERGPGDAPADLVRRLLSAHHVSGDVLDTLADLYRAARYSPGDVDPSMRDAARRSFLRLRDELAGSGEIPAPAAAPVEDVPSDPEGGQP